MPKWHEAQGENKKDPYFYIQVTERNTKKRTALVRKKVISVPFMYKKYESKDIVTLCFAYRKTGLTQLPTALIIIFCLYKIKPSRLYS